MSKSTLESLLAALQKAQQLHAETEALKPKLEKEIAEALDTGDALNEKTAQALQTKRGQLDLIPAKLNQISTRMETLLADIQEEFSSRYIGFNRAAQAAGNATKEKLRGAILPLLPEMDKSSGEEIMDFIFPRTKLAAQLNGFGSSVSFRVQQQDFVGAAKQLLAAEKELASLQATR